MSFCRDNPGLNPSYPDQNGNICLHTALTNKNSKIFDFLMDEYSHKMKILRDQNRKLRSSRWSQRLKLAFFKNFKCDNFINGRSRLFKKWRGCTCCF